MEEIKKQLIVLILSLLVSILVGFLPDWTSVSFSAADQILLSILTFISFLLLDILWVVGNTANLNGLHFRLWKMRNTGEQHLANIRNHYNEIVNQSYGERDVFVNYILRELYKLENITREAAEKKSLLFEAEQFLRVDNVLDAFLGDRERIWRYSWPMSNVDGKLFTELAWKRYFEETAGMIKAKKIKAVKVLIIIGEFSMLENVRVKKLLDFYKTNKGIECKIIKKETFEYLCVDNGISSNTPDFGIYGRNLLYVAQQYIPDTRGIFTKDREIIDKYINLFDTIWNSQSVAKENPSTCSKIVSVQELFEFDDNQAV